MRILCAFGIDTKSTGAAHNQEKLMDNNRSTVPLPNLSRADLEAFLKNLEMAELCEEDVRLLGTPEAERLIRLMVQTLRDEQWSALQLPISVLTTLSREALEDLHRAGFETLLQIVEHPGDHAFGVRGFRKKGCAASLALTLELRRHGLWRGMMKRFWRRVR